MRADLHLHSTASDGMLSPAELVQAAAKAEMNLIALTDHDTTGGIAEAQSAAERLGVDFLPGIELGLSHDGEEVHLLGYGISPEEPAMIDFLVQMREERRQRAREILEKLQRLGISLSYEEVAARARHTLSRSHIAQALVAKGAARDISDAFERYLIPGKPAYVKRAPLEMRDAIGVLQKAGGIAVVAHPGRLRWSEAKLRQKLVEWKACGLAGVEVFHPSHTPGQRIMLEQWARAHEMLVTGGSDYHAMEGRAGSIGDMVPLWKRIEPDSKALREAIAVSTAHARKPKTARSKEE